MKIKNRWLWACISAIGLVIFLLSKFFNSTSPNWVTYTNKNIDAHYSFSYPKEWVLTECGNGDVVVGKKKVDECLSPLAASAEYAENVYFQTFFQRNDYSSISIVDRPAKLPEINRSEMPPFLQGWSVTYFYPQDLGGDQKMIADSTILANFDPKYDHVDDSGNHTPNHLELFTVGFYPHPEFKAEFEVVNKSIKYTWHQDDNWFASLVIKPLGYLVMYSYALLYTVFGGIAHLLGK
jgi:hypothetical protein